MVVVTHLQPRNPRVAARTLAVLAAVAGGVTAVFAAIDPHQQGATLGSVLLTAASALGVAAVAVLLTQMRRVHPWVWAVFPFVAIAAIVGLDLFTRDSSVSAQIFFFFPALYAAFQLRRAGAAAVGAVSVTGNLVVVFALLPFRDALTEGGYLAAAIATTMVLLVHSGEQQDALVAKLREQAAVDSLTGLVTRRVLDEAATSALTGAASELGTGLILLDVDRFKSVNDRFGHPVGDRVLQTLAELLLGGIRPSDTISRMGGDEIAVLLAGCSMHTVLQRAEQLLWDVRAHHFDTGDGTDLAISVSIGVAHLPTHGTDLRTLYSAADRSLYAAKHGGRDRIGPLPDTLPSTSAA